jgi:hypothetical protein
MGTSYEDQYTIWSYLAQFLEWEMFQTKSCRENQNTHCMFSNIFCFIFKSCPYDIMWKYILELDRPQMMIWSMHIVCWLPKATTHAHKICNNYCFYTATVVAWMCNSVMLYIRCLSCLNVLTRTAHLDFSLQQYLTLSQQTDHCTLSQETDHCTLSQQTDHCTLSQQTDHCIQTLTTPLILMF